MHLTLSDVIHKSESVLKIRLGVLKWGWWLSPAPYPWLENGFFMSWKIKKSKESELLFYISIWNGNLGLRPFVFTWVYDFYKWSFAELIQLKHDCLPVSMNGRENPTWDTMKRINRILIQSPKCILQLLIYACTGSVKHRPWIFTSPLINVLQLSLIQCWLNCEFLGLYRYNLKSADFFICGFSSMQIRLGN